VVSLADRDTRAPATNDHRVRIAVDRDQARGVATYHAEAGACDRSSSTHRALDHYYIVVLQTIKNLIHDGLRKDAKCLQTSTHRFIQYSRLVVKGAYRWNV